MKRKILSILVALVLLGSLATIPALAVEDEDIEESIQAGLDWMVPLQNPDDGSWGAGDTAVAYTGFAVVKLEDRAYELGYDSPFDPDYPYRQNVIDGLDFIFSHAGTHGPGNGICWETGGFREVYSTGIAMMAIAASKTPGRTVPALGSIIDDWTYMQVLNANVQYYAWSQKADGGWRYYAGYPGASDNSTTGYAVLGLRYAEYFGCAIPAPLKTNLNNWVNTIQCKTPDGNFGGSGYTSACSWVNVLKTGNLLFEMSFVGDDTSVQRVKDAVSYIENQWNANADPGWRPNHYQAMYCLMKGFESLDIETINVGGDIDWYDEMATIIVDQQSDVDGSWSGCPYYCSGASCNDAGSFLCTVWALLTLEKISPPPPINVEVDVPECACDVEGYDVTVTYTVERFIVDGTLTVKKDGSVYDTVILDDFNGTATETYSIAPDTPGAHTWKAELEVTPSGGGTTAQTDDEDSLNVCETPQVGDIPDQAAPFETFDLDDYLVYGGGGGGVFGWSASTPPEGWTVDIDGNNVVTVTAPEGAIDPVTITFTASVECCQGVICEDSDDATFIPNQPPDCSEAYAEPGCLWPPNHKFVDVSIMGVTDPDDDPITITITAITSDEPTASDEGSGGAKHAPDADGIGTDTASLSAERSGDGDGRVYEISFIASDGRGGECEGSVTVKVPHDQSDETCPAIDNGQNYDATEIN